MEVDEQCECGLEGDGTVTEGHTRQGCVDAICQKHRAHVEMEKDGMEEEEVINPKDQCTSHQFSNLEEVFVTCRQHQGSVDFCFLRPFLLQLGNDSLKVGRCSVTSPGRPVTSSTHCTDQTVTLCINQTVTRCIDETCDCQKY